MQKTLWWFAVLALLAAPGCRKPETPPPITVAQGNAAPSPAAPSPAAPSPAAPSPAAPSPAAPSPAAPSPAAPSPAAPSPAAPSPAQPGKSAAGRQQAKQAKPRASSKASPRQPPPRRGTQPLFIIERNKNANVVHYDAQLTADGKLDPKGPVIAYWVMLAKDGRRQNLNWIEKKKAYGINIKPDPSVNGYQMTIVAATQRSITVKQVGSAVRAEIVIDGRPAILEKMYLNATEKLTGPTVHYLELYGKDVQTGEKRFEKVMRK